MKTNRALKISLGSSRKAIEWKECTQTWAEFTDRLKTPVRGSETHDAYMHMSKAQQDELKDIGGFVGGTLKDGRRKATSVTGRDLITLDLDSIDSGKTEDVLKRVDGLGCAAVVYSTRKHSEYAPRLRVVVPTDRTLTADEYEPAARKLASIIGIHMCDPTTFETNRLMYWASCSLDSSYVYALYDKDFCSADGLLAQYSDWRSVSEWPLVTGAEDTAAKRRLAKAENPTGKKGIVGAFCRTYDIYAAMEAFLPGLYEPTDIDSRYTYTGGSTAGGAIIYDDGLYMYSHHATDPCSGLLVNSFDLVRMHKYADLDRDAKDGTPVNKLPSYVAMTRFAREDSAVSTLLAKERHDEATEAFATADAAPITDKDSDISWMSLLALDDNGCIKKTINNLVLILQHDPNLKGKIVTDEFAGRGIVLGPLPWDSSDYSRTWTDSDDAGIRWYIETTYSISCRDKVEDALSIVAGQHKINAVKEYLTGLTWDGKKRLDTLLQDYLGAEDSVYTRSIMRKSLVAAIARAIKGAVKYDYMPIFTGPQGVGKSTFLATIGGQWFSDSLTTFEGKEAAEIIQGTWINEVGELTAMNRQETEAVKQFLSKTDDIYRAAYGRRTEKYPRRCVFFGTSNDAEFLKDSTGNRRFWPVDVAVNSPTKDIWSDLPKEVDQIWAEAYVRWQIGEPLYLTGEALKLSEAAQKGHKHQSEKEGLIEEYLDTLLPVCWDSMDLMQRRQYLNGNLKTMDELVTRKKVCVAEIWCECFGSDIKYLKRTDSFEISGILKNLEGWEFKYSSKFNIYGNQKMYKRKN